MRRGVDILQHACALWVVFACVPALAQPASAAAAFDEGRALLAAGRVAEACERLAWSHQQEPALGTLLNLADCRERLGETATAFRLFNEAQAWAERNREAKRALAAKGRADALKPRLSMVAVEVVGEAPRATVEVFTGSVPARSIARWSLEVPQTVALDPGRYEVRVEAEGFEPAQVPVAVTVPGVMKVLVPALQRQSTTMTPAPERVALASKPVEVVAPVSVEPPVARWVGPTLVGVGAAFVVGCGVLLGFALDVLARTEAQQQGPTLTVTRQAYQVAVWQAVLGSVGAAAGVAAVSVGVVLLGRQSAPAAQLTVGGRW
jgi:hypothetical protein